MCKPAILCVDDEEIILTSLESLLDENFGEYCNIELAQSAEEGLEILEEFMDDEVSIVVIISDWLMPGMKGDEFLIRVNKVCPNMEKIMLSGHADQNSVKRAEDENALDVFIHKPWDSTNLLKHISNGLKKHGCLE